MSGPVRVGIVGLGFMGRVHARAYAACPGCEVVAVADPAVEAAFANAEGGGNLEAGGGPLAQILPGATRHERLESLLTAGGLDLVSVCTPTDTHVGVAAACLRAGAHVLVEKPVALEAESIERLAGIAAERGRLCAPAMCMRYWPAWAWVREAIRDERYGPVRHARFERLGSPPAWSADFYADEARSGGAMFDLHVHDADFVVHAFGRPKGVTARGDRSHISTAYDFGSAGPVVTAEGGWLPGLGFRMRYTIAFDRAVADFELGREPELVVWTPGGCETPKVESGDGYTGEIRAVVEAVRTGSADGLPTLAEAALVTRMLHAEAASASDRTRVTLDAHRK